MEKSRLDALLADSDSDEDNPAGSPPSASLAPLTLGNALLDDSDDSEEESDTMALREQMAALGAAKQKAAARTARNEDAIEGPEVQHDTSQELTEPETQTQEVEPSEQADAGEKIRKDNRAVVKEEAQDVLLPDTLSNLIEYAQPSPSINVDENCSAVDLSLEVDRKVETEGIRQDEATAQETNPLSIIDPQAVIEMDTAETERERHFESTRVVAEGLGHRIVDEVPSSMQCNDTSFEIEAAHQELPVTQETSLEKEPAVMEVMSAETGDATFTQGEEDDHQLNSSEEAGNAQIADPDPIHTPSKSQGQLAAEEAMLAMGLALPSLSPEPPPALASPLPGASSGSDESNASLLPPSSSSPKEHEASSIVPPIPQTTAQPDVSNLLPMPSTSPYPSQCVAPNSPPPFPTPSKAEVVDSEAEPGGQSMLAPPPPTPKSANATVSPNRSPNVPSISTPSPSSSPSFAAAEKVASSRGHTTMARLLAERQLREEQELQRQQQQQQQLEPVPMASLDDDTDESTKEGSSGFAFIAAEASTPLPDTLHIDAPSGNSQNVSNEQTNHEKHTNAGGVLSNVSDDNDGNGHSNNISSTDRMPLSPRAGPPVWHELPVNAAPQQLGFRPASPSLDGLCLRRIEITWALDASWDDFCDVARTVFMSQGLRTSRPHVAQLCVTRNENNSNNSSSSSSYDHRGGDAFSAGKGAQSMNIPGYGALAQWGLLRCTVGVTAQRLRTVVLEVCTRPLPGGPAAHAAAQALLSYSNGGNNSGSSTTDGYKSSNSNNMRGSSTSSYGGGNGGRGSGGFAQDQQWPKPGEEVVAVLRDAMRGFRLPDDRDNANVQKDTGGEGLFSTPAYSHSLLAQQQPNLASPSSSLLALANQAASAPLRLPVGLDPLYVLQVRAAVVAEGAVYRLQVARPLAKWLEQEEQKAQSFAVNLQPLLTRFLPHASATALPSSRSSSVNASAVADDGSGQGAGAEGEAGGHDGGMSLAAAQQELFGPVHAFAAEQVARSHQGAMNFSNTTYGGPSFGASLGTAIGAAMGGGRVSSSEAATSVGAARSVGAEDTAIEADARHPTMPGGGLGFGWEFATPAALEQASALVNEARNDCAAIAKTPNGSGKDGAVPVLDDGSGDISNDFMDDGSSNTPSIFSSSSSPAPPSPPSTAQLAKALWARLARLGHQEASEQAARVRQNAARRLAFVEARRVAALTTLANRPLPTRAQLAQGNNNSAGSRNGGGGGGGSAHIDPAERQFHKRFRVANEPLLFECAAALRITQAPSPQPSTSGSRGAAGTSAGNLLPGYGDSGSSAATAKVNSGRSASSSVGKVIRRASGRLYVTLAHMWFDAPGGLLSGAEVQEVMPFYTCHRLQTLAGTLGAPGGVCFFDDAGARYQLTLSSHSGPLFGVDLDFGARAGELVEEVCRMFKASHRQANEQSAASPLTSGGESNGSGNRMSGGSGGSGTISGGARRRPATAVDEEEIMARIERIAAMSRRNSALRDEMKHEVSLQRAEEWVAAEEAQASPFGGFGLGSGSNSNGNSGRSGGGSGVGSSNSANGSSNGGASAGLAMGERLLGHVEAFFSGPPPGIAPIAKTTTTPMSSRTAGSLALPSSSSSSGSSNGGDSGGGGGLFAGLKPKTPAFPSNNGSFSGSNGRNVSAVHADFASLDLNQPVPPTHAKGPFNDTNSQSGPMQGGFYQSSTNGNNSSGYSSRPGNATRAEDPFSAFILQPQSDPFSDLGQVPAAKPAADSGPKPAKPAMRSNIEAFLQHAHDKDSDSD